MERRRLPIDWDGLEAALTERHDEWEQYLDLRTGEVVGTYGPADDGGLSEDEIEAGLHAGHLMAIEPLPSSVEYEWMAEFCESERDAGLRKLLAVALDGRGAFRRFKDVLLDYPEERKRWFSFRDERLRQAMEEWLEDHAIEPTTQPRRKAP